MKLLESFLHFSSGFYLNSWVLALALSLQWSYLSHDFTFNGSCYPGSTRV